MDFRILPQEGPQPADNHYYIIRTRVPYSEITEAMLTQRCVATNLSAGDALIVQCYDHNYTTLLHEAQYRVMSRIEQPKVVEMPDGALRSYTEVQFKLIRMHPWWSTPAGAAEDSAEQELLGEETNEVQWNPGKKVFQVLRSGEVIAEHRDKITALEKASQDA